MDELAISSLVVVLLMSLVAADPAGNAVDSQAMDSTYGYAPMTRSADGEWVPYDYGRGVRSEPSLSSGTLVLVAFGLIWAVLAGYVVVLVRRQRRLEAELAALKSLAGVSGDSSAQSGLEVHRASNEGGR